MTHAPSHLGFVLLVATASVAGCSGHSSVAAHARPPVAHVVHCTSIAPTVSAQKVAPFVDHFVVSDGHRIHVREWPGRGPTILLMHGFPDNLHLYDALVPWLAGHHVVAFDFIGWGESDKPSPATYPYTADQQIHEIDTVVTSLHLAPVVVVVHDASGPPGIDWAMRHEARVAKLVLLNTYYSPMPTLRAPEAIAIFSSSALPHLKQLIATEPAAGKELYDWQVGGFFENPAARAKYLPLLFAAFRPELPAFRALNAHLLQDVAERNGRASQLRRFTKPVTIAFGADDPYLNSGVARAFHDLFPHSHLDLIAKAKHYVQMDQPEQVAKAILGSC